MKLILRLKGGPGSGHRGHAGRPGQRGGSVTGAGGGESGSEAYVGSYETWKGHTIHIVQGGNELPDNVVRDARAAEDGMVRVTYNSSTHNWHIASKGIYDTDHADYIKEALEGVETKYTEGVQARGVYDIGSNYLMLYDYTAEAEHISQSFMDTDRLSKSMWKAVESADRNLFTVGGVKPKVEMVPFREMMGVKEYGEFVSGKISSRNICIDPTRLIEIGKDKAKRRIYR